MAPHDAQAKKNIVVVGLDSFNLALLKTIKNAQHYNYFPLFTHDEIKIPEHFPVEEMLAKADDVMGALDRVDAVVGYWDFPVSTMLPLLRRKVGLPSPSFESVLKCEHKYWSRLEQSRVVPQHVPPFVAFNPFDRDPLAKIDLPFPFWIKPIKAASSHLGFRIASAADFHHAIEITRAHIGRFGIPFNHLLQFAQLPSEVADVDGCFCIAEGMISTGRQCTLEGYVFNGEAHVYGVVDSIREGRERSSFSRYQYPSRLPAHVRERMTEIAMRVVGHIGFDHSPFNMEFFWNDKQDSIWLLEVNSRISQSHCPLFALVDGASHHQVMVEIGLGRTPEMPLRQGPYRCAAKFMLRRNRDARVTRIPREEDVRRIQQRFPGTLLKVQVREGMRLSDLRDQDSYSYEIATLFLGAAQQKALLENYTKCLEMLPLRFEE